MDELLVTSIYIFKHYQRQLLGHLQYLFQVYIIEYQPQLTDTNLAISLLDNTVRQYQDKEIGQYQSKVWFPYNRISR